MKKLFILSFVFPVFSAALLCSAGCEGSMRPLGAGTPMADHPIARARMYKDIYKVVKFFPAMPWLSFDEASDPNPAKSVRDQ